MTENTTDNKEQKSKIHWYKVILLFLIFIVFPAGSWYYLTRGYNYRIELLNDIKGDKGNVSDYALTTAQGLPYGLQDFKNNTAIVHFLGEETKSRDSVMLTLKKLHEQFDDRNDILFITHTPNADSAAMSIDTAQWKILTGTTSYLDRIARQNYKLDFKPGETVAENPYLILLDSSRIKKYYDVRDRLQMGRLVEHVTIVMPRLQEKDIILERDKEM